MLNWRNTLPDFDDAGEYAMDQLRSVANSAAKSARDVSGQIESWATDGYESMRDAAEAEPAAFWGAVTVAMGALAGGLFAWWQSSGRKPQRGRSRTTRAMAARSGVNRTMRSVGAAMTSVAKSKTPRKRSRRTSRVKSA